MNCRNSNKIVYRIVTLVLFFSFIVTSNVYATVGCKPPRKDRDDCCDPCMTPKKRQWLIAGGVIAGGIAAVVIGKKIWGPSRNSCPTTSTTNTNTSGTTNLTTGPATLTFTFTDTSGVGSWEGSYVDPANNVFTTPSLTANGTQVLTNNAPSYIGAYRIVFTAQTALTVMGTCTVTTQNGSTTTFTTPVGTYTSGSQVTFELVYTPTLFP